MPSKSKAQHNLMEMAAHDPKVAKRVGVPVKVAKEFVAADKGQSGAYPPKSNHPTSGGYKGASRGK